MDKERKLIKVASIFLFVGFGLLALLTSLFYNVSDFEVVLIIMLIPAIPQLVMGIVLHTTFKDDDVFVRKKGLILAFAIICLLFNLIAAVLLFITHDNVCNYIRKNGNKPVKKITKVIEEKEEEKPVKMTPELKKIDALAKLGAGLVVLSGIILSTSENNIFASDISKPITMATLFVLFRLLYKVFDTKIIIKSSSRLYYYLSHIFFVLIFISIGYFGVLGEYFSFFGNYYRIMYAIVATSLSFSIATINYRYPTKFLGEASFATGLIAFLFVLLHFEFESTQIYGIFLVLTLVIYLLRDNLVNAIKNVNDVVFAMFGLFSLVAFIFDSELVIFKLVLSIFVILLLRLRVVTNDRWACICRYLMPCVTNIVILFTIVLASYDCMVGTNSELFVTATIFNYRLTAIVSLLVSGVLFLRGKDKETVYSGLFSSTILSTILIFTMLNEEYSMIAVLASIILFSFVTVILKMAQKKSIRVFCFIEQFISLLLLSISGILFYINNGIDLVLNTIMFVFIIFTIILNYFEKNIYKEFNIQKIVYYVTIIGLFVLNLVFIRDHSIVYNALMIALMFGYRRFTNVTEDKKYILSYLIIVCTYINVTNILLSYVSVMITCLITLVGLLAVASYIKDDKKLPYLVIVLCCVPYICLLNEIEFPLQEIIIRLPLIVCTYIITRKILDLNKSTSSLFEIIFLIIIFLGYIFEVDLTLGLGTFVLALIMIYIGFRSEKFNSLFIVGIGVTILNIIVQLSDFWSNVPLPVYLLVSGLAIIGYVTYKEVNKDKNKKSVKKKEDKVIKIEINDTVNMITGLLLVGTLMCGAFINDLCIDYKDVREYEKIGFNNNGIKVDHKNNNIYILEGYHYDLEPIAKNKDGYLEYYNVCYLDKDSFKNNYKKYEYYDVYNSYSYGTSRCFYYGPNTVEKNYNFTEGKISVRNSIINYVQMDDPYDYYSKNKKIKFTYNIYDADKLELYFDLKEGYTATVTTSDNDRELFVKSGDLLSVKSSTGVVYVTINKTGEIKENSGGSSYYDSYGNTYYNAY